MSSKCFCWRGTSPHLYAVSCLNQSFPRTRIGRVRLFSARAQNHSISRYCRLSGSRPTPCCVPLLLEELNHLFPLSWSRVREVKLRSPMGRSWTIPRGCYPRKPLDLPGPKIQSSHTWRTERDVGDLSVWSSLYYCSDKHPPGEEIVLSRVLCRSVSELESRFCYGFAYTARLSSTLGYVAFFIIVCVHTPYAEPWIFPCLAFYGFDLLFRMVRSRVKDAILIPVGKQMTLVGVVDLLSFLMWLS